MTKALRPQLPEAVDKTNQLLNLEAAGWWLVLSDVHLPFHDKKTVELAIDEAKKHKVKGVLLNGDILDQHELSRFEKSPSDPRYVDEIKMGRQFLAYLRYHLPRARIVWKDGNHEERLFSYLVSKAPALFGLDVITLPLLLDFARYKVADYVSDRKVIQMGKLNVIHGHEYRPAIQAPVNPARGLFLRAKSASLCGHFHQTSEHHETNIVGKQQGSWSVGCACGLSPYYMPLNKWCHGFALVRIYGQGDFEVRNLRVINGAVV